MREPTNPVEERPAVHQTIQQLTDDLWAALDGEPARTDSMRVEGRGSLASIFPVTELATAAIGAAALAAAEYADADRPLAVTVDRAAASHWFATSIEPTGWSLPSPWDDLAGDYRAADGWIRLHTNAPHHRAAALVALECAADRETVARTVGAWAATDLESAVVAAGGAAAAMRSLDEWREHPQGRAVASEPPVIRRAASTVTTGSAPAEHPRTDRPLAGVRVLDLTRVLAGPVATRFLAGLGAQVLRIDPPTWDEPGVVPDVTLGKRCTRLDLSRATDVDRFVELLGSADVVVHGYRPDALAGLGFSSDRLHTLRPGLVEVSLDAYGWTGPWAGRRGFDSLVQMSAGIADAGMRAAGADRPTPLPVQALDHATGYLMAAAALRGLTTRRRDATGTSACVSLARTALALVDAPPATDADRLDPLDPPAFDAATETTPWGPARRLVPPARIDGVRIGWDLPATDLGADPPRWD